MLWILCIMSATPRDTMYGLVFNRNAEVMSWKYKLGIGVTGVHPTQELGFVSPDSFGKYIGRIAEDYVMGYGWGPGSNWNPTTYRQFPFGLNEINNDGGSSRYDTLAFLAIQHGTDNDKGGLWPFWMWPWTDHGLDSLDTLAEDSMSIKTLPMTSPSSPLSTSLITTGGGSRWGISACSWTLQILSVKPYPTRS